MNSKWIKWFTIMLVITVIETFGSRRVVAAAQPQQGGDGPIDEAPLEPPEVPSESFESTAPTEAPPLETLYLRNGDFVRGVILERVEGSHVIIELVGSSNRRKIPWAELKLSEESSAPSQDPPTGSVGPRVHIQIMNDHPERYTARLEVITGTVTDWEYDSNGRRRYKTSYVTRPVCLAPCGERVSIKGTKGFLVTSSRKDTRWSWSGAVKVSLPPSGRITLGVRPVRRGFVIASYSLLAASLGSILLGALVVRPSQGSEFAPALYASGGAMFVSSLTLWFTSRSRVKEVQ